MPLEIPHEVTFEALPELLVNDDKVKLGGVDIDGQIRGKVISKKKFLSAAKDGFGFCSVIFGWDMHDKTYFKELKISNAENGYHDLIAKIDLNSYRRIPWENNISFFLVTFYDPDTDQPVSACPRGLLKTTVEKIHAKGIGAMAGAEYEFFNFKVPQPGTTGQTPSTATFLRDNPVDALPSLTEGMFGYSVSRPVCNKDYYYDIYDTCEKFDCSIEGWHTESGPGVYEAALAFGEVRQMADRASIFKYVVKSTATKYGITPSFMAKPRQGLPGNSGHVHISLVDLESGKNLFARETPDENAQYKDLEYLSDTGRQFLAGLIEGLPDIMPIFAPTINSYKRLVENFWAPVTVSWGLEHRSASIRLITPPTSKPSATRFEVRVPGADANPFLVLSAILACGWRGIEKKLEISLPPLGKGEETSNGGQGNTRLSKNLREATEIFARKDSVAREVFGGEFVEHFAGTRVHECKLWEEAVTDWEVRRYIETV